jgi:carbon monoxide dehydrogenase subunit G
MEITGEGQIAGAPGTVWAALSDVDALKASLPAVETVEKTSDLAFKFAAPVTFGPFTTRFTGGWTLSDLDPPNGMKVTAAGDGGAAGTLQAVIDLVLHEDGASTKLSYRVDAAVDGKIAALDGALLENAVKLFAADFVQKLNAFLAQPAPHIDHGDHPLNLAHEDHDHDPTNPHYFGLPLGVIIAGAVAAISVGITLAKFFL